MSYPAAVPLGACISSTPIISSGLCSWTILRVPSYLAPNFQVPHIVLWVTSKSFTLYQESNQEHDYYCSSWLNKITIDHTRDRPHVE